MSQPKGVRPRGRARSTPQRGDRRQDSPAPSPKPPRWPEVDLAGIQAVPIASRGSKVQIADLAPAPDPTRPIGDFLDFLPRQLAAEGLRRLVGAILDAAAGGRPVVAMLGGHVVKVGASSALVALARRGVITAFAMNGAAAIHDFELAMWGKTSETVEETLDAGAFGMAGETAELMNAATAEGERQGIGLGEVLGQSLFALRAPYRDGSLLATGYELGIPVTVHVAIGTDILHQHPSASGRAIGETTFRDFRRLAAALRGLSGGVVLNLGSAVIMPEVFLKALSVVRNLGEPLSALTTANFDFQRHYRPGKNVLERPTRGIGEGIEIIGHHEIMLPLLAALVLGGMDRVGARRGAKAGPSTGRAGSGGRGGVARSGRSRQR